jgi:hypothetical protein
MEATSRTNQRPNRPTTSLQARRQPPSQENGRAFRRAACLGDGFRDTNVADGRAPLRPDERLVERTQRLARARAGCASTSPGPGSGCFSRAASPRQRPRPPWSSLRWPSTCRCCPYQRRRGSVWHHLAIAENHVASGGMRPFDEDFTAARCRRWRPSLDLAFIGTRLSVALDGPVGPPRIRAVRRTTRNGWCRSPLSDHATACPRRGRNPTSDPRLHCTVGSGDRQHRPDCGFLIEPSSWSALT